MSGYGPPEDDPARESDRGAGASRGADPDANPTSTLPPVTPPDDRGRPADTPLYGAGPYAPRPTDDTAAFRRYDEPYAPPAGDGYGGQYERPAVPDARWDRSHYGPSTAYGSPAGEQPTPQYGGPAAQDPRSGGAPSGPGYEQPTYEAGNGQPTYGAGYGQPTYGAGYGQPTYGAGYGQPGYDAGYGQPTFGQPGYGAGYGQPTEGPPEYAQPGYGGYAEPVSGADPYDAGYDRPYAADYTGHTSSESGAHGYGPPQLSVPNAGAPRAPRTGPSLSERGRAAFGPGVARLRELRASPAQLPNVLSYVAGVLGILMFVWGFLTWYSVGNSLTSGDGIHIVGYSIYGSGASAAVAASVAAGLYAAALAFERKVVNAAPLALSLASLLVVIGLFVGKGGLSAASGDSNGSFRVGAGIGLVLALITVILQAAALGYAWFVSSGPLSRIAPAGDSSAPVEGVVDGGETGDGEPDDVLGIGPGAREPRAVTAGDVHGTLGDEPEDAGPATASAYDPQPRYAPPMPERSGSTNDIGRDSANGSSPPSPGYPPSGSPEGSQY